MDHDNNFYSQPQTQPPAGDNYHNNRNGSNAQGYSNQNHQGGYNGQRQNNYSGQQQGGYQKKPYGSGGGYQQGGFQRKPKPDFGPIELYKPYAMASNREISTAMLGRMTELAKMLDSKGFTCRIDGAEGASSAVEPVQCRKEVMLAWKGFNEKESPFTYTPPEALELAKKFHPTFETAKPAVQTFLARNVRLVMGQTLKSPVRFLVVWTEDGAESSKDRTSRTGFAGHLIAIASAVGVPVFNLQRPDAEQRLGAWLDKYAGVEEPIEAQSPAQEQRPQQSSYQGNYHGN